MIMNRIVNSAVVVLAMAIGSASATPTTTLSPRDNDFLSKAAVVGIKEVELSRLAQTRAYDARIRSFAEAMVAEHGKANETLGRLAQDNGWNMPVQLDSSGQSAVGKLQERKGDEFDAAYVKEMKNDHDEAVKLFRDAAQSTDNPILRDFAKTTLPTLEHHQAMTTDLK
jgi:putative membrane protein